MSNIKSNKLTRREFVTTSMAALGASTFLAIPGYAHPKKNQNSITVQGVIDLILKSIPNAPFKETTDTIKTGDANQVVSSIVTTMFPTIVVIQKAIHLKANFIIAHEPTFFNHADDTAWLEQDNVYQLKRKLLTENKIAIWRCHDYLHSHRPDGVQMGLLTSLAWVSYANPANNHLVKLQATSLRDIIKHVKERLGIKTVRFIGDPNQICERIGILPGAPGGQSQIQFLQKEHPDVLLCGELREWETAEYVRDARAAGVNLSLVVLGHISSEEPGLQWLAEWLQPQLPTIKITHIPSESPFTWT